MLIYLNLLWNNLHVTCRKMKVSCLKEYAEEELLQTILMEIFIQCSTKIIMPFNYITLDLNLLQCQQKLDT